MEIKMATKIIWLVVVLMVAVFSFSCVKKQAAKKKDVYTKITIGKRTNPGEPQKVEFSRNGIKVKYEKMVYDIEIIEPSIVHVTAEWADKFTKRHSYAVVRKRVARNVKIERNKKSPVIRQGDLSVHFFPDLQKYIIKKNGKVVFASEENGFYKYVSEVQVLKNNSYHRTLSKTTNFRFNGKKQGRYFGLGEKTGKLELTGRSFIFFNKDTYKYTTKTDPIYSTFPFYLSISKDSSYGMFTECMAKGAMSFETNYQFEINDRKIEQYIIVDDPKNIIKKYTSLTGKPAMPPAWALGFHQSRYSYRTQKEVLSVVSNFRQAGIPLDAIYLDIGFMDRNRSFTYDKNLFPDPKKLNELLKKDRVRSVAIVDPGIGIDPTYSVYKTGKDLDVFVKQNGKDYKGRVWPGDCAFPDYTNPRTRRWWGKLYSKLFKLGVAGIWNDMNEPSDFGGIGGTFPLDVQHNYEGNPTSHQKIHNIYGLTMVMATFQGMKKLKPRERPFILSRAGYSGLQRYAFLWTGDNTADWSHLQMNLSMVMNSGLSGMPFCGSDVGGYTGAPSKELFVRWIQLGAFIPFFRDHTEKGTPSQEPYKFKKHLKTIRKYIQLRYKLFPYLYTQVYQAHKTGLPLVRPLFLDYGYNQIGNDEQFLFGSSMMIAPVLHKGEKYKAVTLPKGKWYDYWNEKEYDVSGDSQTLKLRTTLKDIPIFVKGGSIIPKYSYAAASTLDFSKHRDLLLKVYPDSVGKATGEIYEDDMISYNFKRGIYSVTKMDYKQKGSTAHLTIKKSRGKLRLRRAVIVQLPSHIKVVYVNGKKRLVKNGEMKL